MAITMIIMIIITENYQLQLVWLSFEERQLFLVWPEYSAE